MKDWNTSAQGRKFVASYSGGKDSRLALYKAMQMGKATALITRLRSSDGLAGAHGVSHSILQAQAQAMNLPLLAFYATWENYKSGLIQCIQEAKDMGAEVLVTGDIDLPEHNCWHEDVAQTCGVSLAVPLWQRNRKDVVDEFLSLGFVSKVVSVDLSKGMKESDLGRIFTKQFVKELEARGVDCCGESGEFHTIVLDGPIFSAPLTVKEGFIRKIDHNLCLDLEIVE